MQALGRGVVGSWVRPCVEIKFIEGGNATAEDATGRKPAKRSVIRSPTRKSFAGHDEPP